MLDPKAWQPLSDYVRGQLLAFYDPAFPRSVVNDSDFSINHKGFYIGLVSHGQTIIREGFLQEDCKNVKYSADKVISQVAAVLKSENVSRDKFDGATLHFCTIWDCIYISDPLSWDQNKDGVFFQWGQRYKGLLLPHEIKRMNTNKVTVMDKLCARCGIPSSLWKLDTGLVFRLVCDSF